MAVSGLQHQVITPKEMQKASIWGRRGGDKDIKTKREGARDRDKTRERERQREERISGWLLLYLYLLQSTSSKKQPYIKRD